ncbi:RNA polymerase sigma factor [Mycolicibacterium arenosum]|uniref:Sigma-70 family RNA polymerase sigma factor n=1 Tax=Mycolicibacterium arenosum TaxID=2952157 RepID=A0ABT1MAK2_9MYCO|nr:sigma-70 family RNA polymerase sigma factor [Mycolicibacterium sp. CAU 1645]MCP9276186.1 sigma-70 family RNA polymerase sigma factor [Mycolicibacterium sp. CAU 1645]
MTAVPQPDRYGPPTDAALASAAARGDQQAFGMIYDRYADRLMDYACGMLRDRDTAADCVHDAFCTAAGALDGLRDPDKLRPWLYAIVRGQVLHHMRDTRRETPVAEHYDTSSDEPEPHALAARRELASLVAEAAGGLSERDQQVLDLTYRHGLDGPELAEVLGVSQTNANTLVHRMRETVERSLGALLVARRASSGSHECQELCAMLADWDGRLTVLMRKRIGRHIDSCSTCEDQRRSAVTPAALLGGAPVFVAAPPWLRDATLDDIELVNHSSALPADGGTRGDRAGWVPMTLFIAALAAAVGLGALYLSQRSDDVMPVDRSTTLAPPAAPVSAPPAAPSTQPPPATTPPPPVQTPRSNPPPPVTTAPPPEPTTPTAAEPTPEQPPAPTPSTPPPWTPPQWTPPQWTPPQWTPPNPQPPQPVPGGPTGIAPVPATPVVPVPVPIP